MPRVRAPDELCDPDGHGLTCGCAALPPPRNPMPRPAPRRATAGARPAASPWTLLGDTHRALLAWPEGVPGALEARALRDALAAHVRAVLCAHSLDGRAVPSRKAAVALGVSLSHLQRWRAKGGPVEDV